MSSAFIHGETRMNRRSSARRPRLTTPLARCVPAVWSGLFVALLVMSGPQPALAQLSCTTTQITSAAGVDRIDGGPSLNANGTRIAFESTADLTGNNPDRSSEIFLFDSPTGTLTQLTASNEYSFYPSINAEGTRFACAAPADLPGGNPDGNAEIFLVDTTTATLTQLTASSGASGLTPSINADGTRIAFASAADLTGGNPDGSFEVFLVDTATGTLAQLTASSQHSFYPSINADGPRIGFQSRADLTGGNPDGSFELFLVDTTTGALAQITASNEYSFNPSINADGTRIAFASAADLTGDNPDGSEEIFLFDSPTGTFTQLTASSQHSSYPSI